MSAKKLTGKMVREDALFEELQEEPIERIRSGPVSLVRMVRDPVYGAPSEAYVHPDEVDNWQMHNWQIEE